MPYIADMKKANDLQQAKKLVGNGQCVSLVHAVAVIPPASTWHQGDLVMKNKDIVPGTVIATYACTTGRKSRSGGSIPCR